MVVQHKFQVKCSVQAGECLAVTGSSQDLGRWKRQHVQLMVQDLQHSDVWHLNTCLDEEDDHLYRYCVVVILQPLHPGSPRRIIVRRWETHLLPRKIRKTTNNSVIDTFGIIDGKQRIQRGWLTDEMMIQFKLSKEGLTIYKKKYSQHRLWVKMTPLVKEWGHNTDQEVNHTEESIDIQDVRDRNGTWPIVEAAALTGVDCVRKVQTQFGIEYKISEDSFVLFEAQLLNPSAVAFLVDIYALPPRSHEHDIPDHIGMCYIYPDNFKQTMGKLQTPITSMKFQPLGKLTVDYLMIHPTPQLQMDFCVSYRNYWDEDWKGLDVGHRGLGNSYTKGHHCSSIKENTIASMRDAVQHGADMVEFDVQVSKDLVPIVFHEFNLCVQTKTKKGGDIMLDVPVKDLTLAELQGLKSHHPSEKEDGVKSFGNDGDEDHEPFPTLENVLISLDINCGFNIEIKYGQMMKDGKEEDKNPMEMNLFLDQVLKTVLRNGGDRKIIFSSFNPDVCTMMINKQNKYPVLLLTQGENSKYDDFMDPRTWSIRNGVWFAEMIGLLGLSAMAEALIRDPTQMELVKSRGQVLFCWTDEQNDKETVKYLKQLGVNGVIYDRMDQYNDKTVKESIFVSDNKLPATQASAVGSSSGCSSESDCSPKSSPSASPVRSSSSLSFSGAFNSN